MIRTPCIDFDERFFANGTQSLVLRCAELSAAPRRSRYDYSYCILVEGSGQVTMRSRADGKGSIRYYTAATVDAAIAHGIRWAQRKLKEIAA